MKHQFLTAFFSAFLCAIASTAADAQSLSNKSAFELSAGIGHSTSSQYLDTASAGAGLRFGALLGENIRLIAGVSRNFDRLTERRDLQNGDDRGTSFSLAAAWDIASAHEVSLGYFYSRYEYNFVGMPAQLAVQENEILSLNYSYFADWGQAGAGVSELLGDSSSTIFRVNGLCCTNRMICRLPLTPDGFTLRAR
ncbi:hypothetical protein [Pseudophaeobacter sp.]|uniref:hypothetical protein n=1 Tax=Pseudophaeobacter sp. TaxID=1971739 RepID=UPI00405830D0